ncbi:MAG: acyltransferase [Deltaproteobacteria bacterium]|nr:acyltransferase [Deltaproteobacteria bacterium]
MSTHDNRIPLLDAFKAIASQVIVLHHLVSYGPLALAAQEIAPGIINWLYGYGRIAVQVFLVLGGFLAARSLSPDGDALHVSPLGLIWKRYQRLAIPNIAAICMAIACSALASCWMADESIPAPATFDQWLAHVFLLQDLLGYESLSAGIWYIAIDFQLFTLMTLLLWIGRVRPVAPMLVLSIGLCSLFWFNRDAVWDNWALYFFGSYGLGAAAWWASERKQASTWLFVLAAVGVAALIVNFRLRIAVALAVALVLGCSRRSGLLDHYRNTGMLAFLGRISYSVFLVHFPILLIVNALFVRFGFLSPVAALFGMLASWAASIAAAALFYRWIENPSTNGLITGAFGLLFGKTLKYAHKAPWLASFLNRE